MTASLAVFGVVLGTALASYLAGFIHGWDHGDRLHMYMDGTRRDV